MEQTTVEKMNEFNEALGRFVRMLAAAMDAYRARNHPASLGTCDGVSLTVESGKRNIRIVTDHGRGSRSVYCFIEQETGKIMKAAGWKSPEPKRYERGNIFRTNPLEGCGPYGVEYRTGGGNYDFAPADLGVAEKSR